jgi:hypothetical protein
LDGYLSGTRLTSYWPDHRRNGAAAGSTIHWTLNGNPISSWDNTAFIRFGCTRNVLYQIGVQVAAPSGETSTSTRGVRCTNNPPV